MSRDVVFDESALWYKSEPTPPEPSSNELDDTKADDQLRSIPEETPITTRLNEPQEPPREQSTSRRVERWKKGRTKCQNEDDQYDNNESTHSLDNEFGAFDVPLMRTPSV